MVYLDYNASTPMDPRVAEVVWRVMQEHFANPSSTQHASGRAARDVIEEARTRVAALVGAAGPQSVVFTSGASEAASLSIVGVVLGCAPTRKDVVVAATEHKAVLEAGHLAAELVGGICRVAPVDRHGRVDVDALGDLLDDSTALVAVMAVNNETGVIGDLPGVAEQCRQVGALFFSDLTQAYGKLQPNVAALGVDIAVLSSHKIYGPRGAGAIVADRRTQRLIKPLFRAGGQERGLRGGTQDVAAIAGFGVAAELAALEWEPDSGRLAGYREGLVEILNKQVTDVTVNGAGADRVANTVSLRFAGADADAVMASAPNIEVSTGSACQAAVTTPSHVLTAMGLDSTAASECVRVSLGRPTTESEVVDAAEQLGNAVNRVRELSAA